MEIRENLIWFPDDHDEESYTAELYHLNSQVTACTSEKYGRYIELISSNPIVNKEWSTDRRELAHLATVALPPPETLERPLGTTVHERTSTSYYANRPISIGTLSTVLHHSMGCIDDSEGQRRFANPSAGALYCCKGYAVLFNVEGISSGTYHYNPSAHQLETIETGDLRSWFGKTVFSDGKEGHAAGALILTIRLEDTFLKYNDRGYRYALFECGHIAQNLLLSACALDLAATPIGGFVDDDINTRLGLAGERESAAYIVLFGRAAVGRPAIGQLPSIEQA